MNSNMHMGFENMYLTCNRQWHCCVRRWHYCQHIGWGLIICLSLGLESPPRLCGSFCFVSIRPLAAFACFINLPLAFGHLKKKYHILILISFPYLSICICFCDVYIQCCKLLNCWHLHSMIVASKSSGNAVVGKGYALSTTPLNLTLEEVAPRWRISFLKQINKKPKYIIY